MSYRLTPGAPLLAALVAFAAVAGPTALSTPAEAQQMGREPTRAGSGLNRNPSLAAQFQFQQRVLDQQNGGGSGGGIGALNQYVNMITSSSTSIGNLSQVTQNLGDGATASVGSTAQKSDGDQSATSDMENVTSAQKTPPVEGEQPSENGDGTSNN